MLTSPRPSNSCTVRMSWLSSNKCGANEARHGQRTEELHDLDCSHLRRVALAVKYDVPANAGHTRLLGASAAMASAQYFAHPVEETRLARSREAGFTHGEGRPRGVRVEEAGGGQGAHTTGIIGPASGTPQDVADAIRPRARGGSGGGNRAGAGQGPGVRPQETACAARPHVRRYALRYRTHAATGPGPRSTPQGACFITSPDATTTSVAREVKPYLASAPPSSSPPFSPGLIASSSSVRHLARSGLEATTPEGLGPCPRTAGARARPEATPGSSGGRVGVVDRANRQARCQALSGHVPGTIAVPSTVPALRPAQPRRRR